MKGAGFRICFVAVHESAYGTKRTWRSRSAMSAFGGKADIPSSHDVPIKAAVATLGIFDGLASYRAPLPCRHR